jgi:hypothetical protein
MRRSVTVALLGALLAVTAAAGPASACVCGVIAPGAGGTVAVESERAVVSWADGVQSIDLSLGVDSAVAQAGLIVPTPAPATVTPGDPALFDAVSAASAPTPEYFDDWWGTASTEESESAVVSGVRVGALEATALPAADTGALTAWLQQNGYTLTPEQSAQFAQYAAKGWSFVAVKLAADPALSGTLEPIRISFPSPTLVYPAGLSRASAAGETLQVAVLSDHRARFVLAGTPDTALNAAERTVWAGPVTEGPLVGAAAYLTVSELRFDQPAGQIVGDIGIVAAPNDDPVTSSVTVVRPISLLGFPLGTLLAVWGGIGVALLLAGVVARLRLR